MDLEDAASSANMPATSSTSNKFASRINDHMQLSPHHQQQQHQPLDAELLLNTSGVQSVMARVRQKLRDQQQQRNSAADADEDDIMPHRSTRRTSSVPSTNQVTQAFLWELLLRFNDSNVSVMKEAEQSFLACESSPGFYSSLFEILLNRDIQLSSIASHQYARHIIARLLRKDVERHWASGGNRGGTAAAAVAHKLSDAEKQAIRTQLVNTCLHEPQQKVMQAISDIIAQIARHDVPDPWQTLIEHELLRDKLIAGMQFIDTQIAEQQPQLERIQISIETFARTALILERVVKSVASKRFIKHRSDFVQTKLPNLLFEPIGNMWLSFISKCDMFLKVDDAVGGSNAALLSTIRTRLLDTVLLLTKLLHHIIAFGLTARLRDVAVLKRDRHHSSPSMDDAGDNTSSDADNLNVSHAREQLLGFVRLVYSFDDGNVYDQLCQIRSQLLLVHVKDAELQQSLMSKCDTTIKRLDKITTKIIENVGALDGGAASTTLNDFLPIILQRYKAVAFSNNNNNSAVAVMPPSPGSLRQALVNLSAIITKVPAAAAAAAADDDMTNSTASASAIARRQLVLSAFSSADGDENSSFALLSHIISCLVRYAVLDVESGGCDGLHENGGEEFALQNAHALEALNIDLRTAAQYFLARLTKLLQCEPVLRVLFALLVQLPTNTLVSSAKQLYEREALYSLIGYIKPQLFDYLSKDNDAATVLLQLHVKLHADLHELLLLYKNNQKSGADDEDEVQLAIVVVCHRIVTTYGEYFFMPSTNADHTLLRSALSQLAATNNNSNAAAETLLPHNFLFLLHALDDRVCPPVMVRLAALDILHSRVFSDPKWQEDSEQVQQLAPRCHEILHYIVVLMQHVQSHQAQQLILTAVHGMMLAMRNASSSSPVVPVEFMVSLCRTVLKLNDDGTTTDDARKASALRYDISSIQLQTKVSVVQALLDVLAQFSTTQSSGDKTDAAAAAVPSHLLAMSDLVAALVLEAVKPLANESFAESTLNFWRQYIRHFPAMPPPTTTSSSIVFDVSCSPQSPLFMLIAADSAVSVRFARQMLKQVAELCMEITFLILAAPQNDHGGGFCLMFADWCLKLLRGQFGAAAVDDSASKISLDRHEQQLLTECLANLMLLISTATPSAPPLTQLLMPDLVLFALFELHLSRNVAYSTSKVNEAMNTRSNVMPMLNSSSANGGNVSNVGKLSVDTWNDILLGRVLYTTPLPLLMQIIAERCVIPIVMAAQQPGTDVAVELRIPTQVQRLVQQAFGVDKKQQPQPQQLDDRQALLENVCGRVLAQIIQTLVDQPNRVYERYAMKWVFLGVMQVLLADISRVQLMSSFLLHFLNETMHKHVRSCPRKQQQQKVTAAAADPSQILDNVIFFDLLEKHNFRLEHAATPGERRKLALLDSNDAAYLTNTSQAIVSVLRQLKAHFGADVFMALLQADSSAVAAGTNSLDALFGFSPSSSSSTKRANSSSESGGGGSNMKEVNFARSVQLMAADIEPLITFVLKE